MKKYDVVLQKYDELHKMGITTFQKRLIAFLTLGGWIGYVVIASIYKDNQNIQLGSILLIAITIIVFILTLVRFGLRSQNFVEKNKEYFKYKANDVLDYIELKKQGYSSNHIKDYINILVDEHYQDKDKMKEELYKYIHRDNMVDDLIQLSNYEQMSKDLDVEV